MHKKGDTTTFLMYSITAAVYIPGSTSWLLNTMQNVSNSGLDPFNFKMMMFF